MQTSGLYETEFEKRQHLSAIHVLSRELGISESSIQQLYENELKEIREYARVRDFLPVLVIRRIKGRLRTGKI
jgi:uncharacterized protein YqgQ